MQVPGAQFSITTKPSYEHRHQLHSSICILLRAASNTTADGCRYCEGVSTKPNTNDLLHSATFEAVKTSVSNSCKHYINATVTWNQFAKIRNVAAEIPPQWPYCCSTRQFIQRSSYSGHQLCTKFKVPNPDGSLRQGSSRDRCNTYLKLEL